MGALTAIAENRIENVPTEYEAIWLIEQEKGVVARGGWLCPLAFNPFSAFLLHKLCLLRGDSSTSARMAMRSSLAEITGKRMSRRHPNANKHCREVNLRLAGALKRSCQSRNAGSANSSHARLRKSSRNPPRGVSFPEESNLSQRDYSFGKHLARKTGLREHSYPRTPLLWESRRKQLFRRPEGRAVMPNAKSC